MTRVELSRWRAIAAALGALATGLLVPAPAAAEWTTPVNLSQSGQNAFDVEVAVEPDGDAVFVWQRFDGASLRVQTRARSAAGVLSPVQTLSGAGVPSGPQGGSPAQVAVDADGDAVFTWLRSDGANNRVETRSRSAAGVLSPVQTLSAAGQDARSPQVAVDPDGDAVFAWERDESSASFSDRIQARARSAAGTLSPVQNVSAAPVPPFERSSLPQVAIDATGDAVFTWVRYDGANFRVQTRARTSGGTFSAVQNLSAAGQDAEGFFARVAVAPNGDAVYTWAIYDDINESCCARIQARARSAAGALSPVQTLSPPGAERERSPGRGRRRRRRGLHLGEPRRIEWVYLL